MTFFGLMQLCNLVGNPKDHPKKPEAVSAQVDFDFQLLRISTRLRSLTISKSTASNNFHSKVVLVHRQPRDGQACRAEEISHHQFKPFLS